VERFLAIVKWLSTDEHWTLVVAPPFILIILLALFLGADDDNPLNDREIRTATFNDLVKEMESLEPPPNTGIGEVEGHHKASSILIKRHYHSDANRRDDVLRSIHESLIKRGWIHYSGRPERIAITTYHYRRGPQEATLYLLDMGYFRDASKDDWDLIFTQG